MWLDPSVMPSALATSSALPAAVTVPSTAGIASAVPIVHAVAAGAQASPDWKLEFFKAVAAVVVGGLLSAFVTYLAWKRQAKHEAAQNEKEHTRNLLQQRLALQREAFGEYAMLLTKYQAEDPGGFPHVSIQEIHARKKSREREAHEDGVRMFAKLSLAFGEQGFAQQAADLIPAMSGSPQDSSPRLTIEIELAPRVMTEMVKSIRATEGQLENPPMAYVPQLGDAKAYNREKGKLFAYQLAERHGFDPAKVDELFDKRKAGEEVAKPE